MSSRRMTPMTAAKKGAKGVRPAKALHPPLQLIVDEFLEEVEQTLAPTTGRAAPTG